MFEFHRVVEIIFFFVGHLNTRWVEFIQSRMQEEDRIMFIQNGGGAEATRGADDEGKDS